MVGAKGFGFHNSVGFVAVGAALSITRVERVLPLLTGFFHCCFQFTVHRRTPKLGRLRLFVWT
ncbi:hypothetical protein [Pseudovibrio denitrificans]|uniref:hypothetical protein n=1 Tax=Pseudovibrio denitrificans TaxID=258256 RepID=UPI000AD268B4|nr:hypothetical protein [Pseudovibrio denitrificans]